MLLRFHYLVIETTRIYILTNHNTIWQVLEWQFDWIVLGARRKSNKMAENLPVGGAMLLLIAVKKQKFNRLKVQ